VAVLTFTGVERILGRSLPTSARKHRPWWRSHDGSPQARAWLTVGRRVATVDLAGEKVTFERTAAS
jgi:hypothetical protein